MAFDSEAFDVTAFEVEPTRADLLRGHLGALYSLFGLLQQVGDTLLDLIGPITVYRGDSLEFRITITDDEDERVSLSAVTSLEVQVVKNLGDEDPLIGKAFGTGITALPDSGETVGQADCVLTSTDTDLDPGVYWLDVVAIVSGRRGHVLAPTEFVIEDVANRL